MQKIALNVAGIIFIVAAEIHLVRWVLKVPVIVGDTSISPESSAIGAVIVLLLALWMLIVARRTGPQNKGAGAPKAKVAIKLED
jgi:H+/Cl- antiporter ClcA